MARVPPLPYRVVVYRKKVGLTEPAPENHNYPDFPGAEAYRKIALSKPYTRKVEVLFVLDESTPDHQDSAVPLTNGHNHTTARRS